MTLKDEKVMGPGRALRLRSAPCFTPKIYPFPPVTRGELDSPRIPRSTKGSNYVRWKIDHWRDFNSIRLLKGIIRPFELKEIYLFYYFIDAGEFSYANDMH